MSIDLLLKPHLLEAFLSSNDESKEVIPKNVFQTHAHKHLIPDHVIENVKKYSRGYNYFLFDDFEAMDFLKNNFQSPVITAFQSLEGPHKADLFRYALLFTFGGIYIDIKTEPLVPFDYLFKDNRTLYTSLSVYDTTVFTGVIASPKHNLFFLKLINQVIHMMAPQPIYNFFVSRFYEQIKYEANQTSLHEGLNRGIKDTNNYILFREENRTESECYDGFDRYKGCYFVIYRGEKVFKSRYSDYPWSS